jgi:aspartokinase
MNTLVMKFGGSSVGNTAALTQVLSIVLHEQPRWQRLLVQDDTEYLGERCRVADG